MHLCYFDENKHNPTQPFFTIGGLILPDVNAADLENTLRSIAYNFFGSSSLTVHNELHGKELFHGKGNCKGRELEHRVQVFKDVSEFIVDNALPVRMV